jgi:outer membrane protein
MLLALVLGALGLSVQLPANALDLQEAYELALNSDAQYQAAIATYEAAVQAKPLARSGYLPQINLDAGYNRNRQDINTSEFTPQREGETAYYNDYNYGLSLSQAIYRREAMLQMRQADASIDQALAELEAAEQDLIVRVATEYFGVLAANDNLTFTTAAKEAVARQLEQAKKRFEVGLIAITDVKEAQAQYDTAVADEIRAQNNLENAYESLAVVTGVRRTDLAKLIEDIPLLRPNPDEINAWVERAQTDNRSLAAARAAVEVAHDSVALARAGRHPTLDFVASAQRSDVGEGSFFGERNTDDALIGLQFNLPIYTGGFNQANTRQAAAELESAQQQLVETQRRTVQQTRDAYLGVISGISQVEAFARAVESNEAALEATEAGFEVGTRTSVDVLIAVQRAAGALRDYASSRYTYILNGFSLKQAAGTLAPDDVLFVNRYLEQ